MPYVSGVIFAVVGMWVMYILITQFCITHGIILTLGRSWPREELETRKIHFIDALRRELRAKMRLWPLMMALLAVAILLLVIG